MSANSIDFIEPPVRRRRAGGSYWGAARWGGTPINHKIDFPVNTNLNLYTGKTKYKEIEFDFVFDGKELRLIPPIDKTNEVRHKILMKEIGEGAYTFASPTMEDVYLIGVSNETGQTLIFLTKQGMQIGSYNEVLFVEIAAYILCKLESHPISKMSFACPELDCIHPVTQGYQCEYNPEKFHNLHWLGESGDNELNNLSSFFAV